MSTVTSKAPSRAVLQRARYEVIAGEEVSSAAGTSAAHIMRTVRNRVPLVCPPRVPAQVADVVIRRVAVVMAALLPFFGRAYPGQEDKAVDSCSGSSPVPFQLNLVVARPPNMVREEPRLALSSRSVDIRDGPHLAGVGYLELPSVPRQRLKLLHRRNVL